MNISKVECNGLRVLVPGAVVLSALVAGMSSVQADEYSLKYGVTADYEYNDNVGLSPNDKIDISGGQLAIPVTLASRSERLNTSLAGELAFSRFDDSGYNSDDQNLEAKLDYLLERGELEGSAGFKRASTRTTEFDDTGVVGLDASRVETATLGGAGSYLFTEKNGITGGVDYRQVDYQSDAFQDYSFVTGYGGWINQWSERTRLRLQGYFSRYINDDGNIDVESDTLGFQAGFDSKLSERLSTAALIGWANTDTSFKSNTVVPPDDDSAGSVLVQGSVSYREERYQLDAKVMSEPSPTGNGTLYARHTLDLAYRYQLTERSRFDLGLTVGQQSAVDDGINNDRDWARIVLRLDYRIAENWYVAGRYQYSYQDLQQATGDAYSNAIFLSLIFEPENQLIWSR